MVVFGGLTKQLDETDLYRLVEVEGLQVQQEGRGIELQNGVHRHGQIEYSTPAFDVSHYEF